MPGNPETKPVLDTADKTPVFTVTPDDSRADLFNVDMAKAYPGSASDSHSFLSVLNHPAKQHQRPGMVVTTGSYRLGDWKRRFRRRGGSTDHKISEAVLHNLSDDPADLMDVSDLHTEKKQTLFADYQQFVAARKSEAAGRAGCREEEREETSAAIKDPQNPDFEWFPEVSAQGLHATDERS